MEIEGPVFNTWFSPSFLHEFMFCLKPQGHIVESTNYRSFCHLKILYEETTVWSGNLLQRYLPPDTHFKNWQMFEFDHVQRDFYGSFIKGYYS